MERKEPFFKILNNRLSKDGFEYKPNRNCFVKKENGNEFTYRFEAWPAFMQILPHYEIVIKSVEDIKKKAWGKGYKKYWSVGQTKFYVTGKPLPSATMWTDTEQAIVKSANEELAFYDSFVKTYFQNYADVAYLDKELNTNPDENRIVAFNNIHTSFLAIIVAGLTNNPQLPGLIDFYRPIVQKRNAAFLEDYELLAAYLLA